MSQQMYVFLLTFAMSATYAQQTSDLDIIEQQLQTAQQYLDSLAYDQALSLALDAQQQLKQTALPINRLLADAYRIAGSSYVRKRNLAEAKRLLKQAANLYTTNQPVNWTMLAETYSNRGVAFAFAGDFKTAATQFEKALETIEKSKAEDQAFKTASYLSNLGMAYYYLNDFEQASYHYKQTLAQFQGTEAERWNQYGLMQYRLGLIALRKGNVELALDYYESALADYKNRYGKNVPIVADMYGSIADLYLRQGNFEAAITYSEYSSQLYEQILGIDSDEYLRMLYPKVEALYSLDLEREASALDKQILEALQRIHQDKPRHFRIAVQLAEIGIKEREVFEEPAVAVKKLQTALAWLEQSEVPVEEEIARYTMNLGVAYHDLKYFAKAEEYLQRAIVLHESLYASTPANLFLPYRNLASLYKDIGNSEQALHYYTLAEQAVGLSPKASLSAVAYPFFTASQVAEKGQLFAEKYEQQQTSNVYLMADSLFRLSLNLTQQAQRAGEQASQVSLQKRIVPALEGLLRLRWQGYQQQPTMKMLADAFAFMERGKSFVLYQAVLRSGARQFAPVPDALLQQEQQLKADIAFYEKELYHSSQASSETVTQWKDLLFSLKNDYQNLRKQLEKDYPNYFQLRYRNVYPDLAGIQQQLASEQQILEYFVGEQHIYLLSITADEVRFLRLENDFSLEEQIETLRQALYDKNDNFIPIASRLYQKLLQPLGPLRQRLLIIPDGRLHYLPFEILLTQRADSSANFAKLPYLLRQHTVSYNYSVLLWQQMQSRSYHTKRLLAIAPSFPVFDQSLVSRENDLGQLVFNQQEARQISALFSADMLLDSAATLSSFWQRAPQYSMLHLATHAKLDDQRGDYSYLAFFGVNDTTQRAKLYVKDLYNLQLPVDMVVLSACETGIGKLRNGEGVISLARGFTYAGAKSLITSLWTVNDRSTAQLMTAFYKNLKAGMSKDEAMRTAKLSFLDSQAGSHPYFWAGFIPLGDMQALPVKYGKWWWIVLAIGLTAGLIFFFFQKKLKKR